MPEHKLIRALSRLHVQYQRCKDWMGIALPFTLWKEYSLSHWNTFWHASCEYCKTQKGCDLEKGQQFTHIQASLAPAVTSLSRLAGQSLSPFAWNVLENGPVKSPARLTKRPISAARSLFPWTLLENGPAAGLPAIKQAPPPPESTDTHSDSHSAAFLDAEASQGINTK